jgi:carboxypeptidase C (cathepsin A)
MPTTYLTDIEGNEPYNASMFFWYFNARNDPEHAPTAIYLAGGPGDSSMFGATEDGGPCTVNPDSNSTEEGKF